MTESVPCSHWIGPFPLFRKKGGQQVLPISTTPLRRPRRPKKTKKTKEDNCPKTNEHPHVHDRLCCCCRTAAPNRRVYACPRKAATDLSEPHPGFNRLRLLGGLATSSNWESPVGDNPVAYSEVIPQGASIRRIVRSRRFKFGRPPHSRHSKNFGCESFPHQNASKKKKDTV